MKKILYISFLAAMMLACQTNSKQVENIVTPTPNGVPSASSATPPSGPVQQNVSAPSDKRPANNPPHGQPFHECSIPVGAPLNAKASSPATPVATPASAAPTGQQIPATNKEVKLNPPHGQPGHSCKISVGAPLT